MSQNLMAQRDRSRTPQGDVESLERHEREWLTAVSMAGAPIPEEVLSDDFTATTGLGVLDRNRFIDALRDLQKKGLSIALDENRMRVYGETIVSTGRATVRAASGSSVSGQAGIAAQSGTADFSRMARESANSNTAGKEIRAAPAPMPAPQDEPMPNSSGGGAGNRRYRYTAVYVHRRSRWQLVALHITETQ